MRREYPWWWAKKMREKERTSFMREIIVGFNTSFSTQPLSWFLCVFEEKESVFFKVLEIDCCRRQVVSQDEILSSQKTGYGERQERYFQGKNERRMREEAGEARGIIRGSWSWGMHERERKSNRNLLALLCSFLSILLLEKVSTTSLIPFFFWRRNRGEGNNKQTLQTSH